MSGDTYAPTPIKQLSLLKSGGVPIVDKAGPVNWKIESEVSVGFKKNLKAYHDFQLTQPTQRRIYSQPQLAILLFFRSWTNLRALRMTY